MTIYGPKTEPNLLNTIDKLDRSAFPIRLQHQKTDLVAANQARGPSVAPKHEYRPTYTSVRVDSQNFRLLFKLPD